MDEKFVDDALESSSQPGNQHEDTVEEEEEEMEVAAAPDVDALQDAKTAATNAETEATSPGTAGVEDVADHEAARAAEAVSTALAREATRARQDQSARRPAQSPARNAPDRHDAVTRAASQSRQGSVTCPAASPSQSIVPSHALPAIAVQVVIRVLALAPTIKTRARKQHCNI